MPKVRSRFRKAGKVPSRYSRHRFASKPTPAPIRYPESRTSRSRRRTTIGHNDSRPTPTARRSANTSRNQSISIRHRSKAAIRPPLRSDASNAHKNLLSPRSRRLSAALRNRPLHESATEADTSSAARASNPHTMKPHNDPTAATVRNDFIIHLSSFLDWSRSIVGHSFHFISPALFSLLPWFWNTP